MRKHSDDFVHRLYQTHYEKMLHIAYRMLGDVEQAEDVVQDVFLQAMFHRSQLAEHPNPDGWLMITLRNLIQSERRRSAIHSIVPLDSIPTQPDVEPEMPLETILPAKLPREDRNILIWRYEQGLSYREIADKLGISEGNSRIRLYRAILRCRKLFESE